MMDETESTKRIAQLIAEFRMAVRDKMRTDIEQELGKMEAEGFDPSRGRGRGPWWADGA